MVENCIWALHFALRPYPLLQRLGQHWPVVCICKKGKTEQVGADACRRGAATLQKAWHTNTDESGALRMQGRAE